MKKTEIKAIVFDVGGVIFLIKNKKKRQTKNLLTSYKEFCFLLKGINIPREEFWEKTLELFKKSSGGEVTKKQNLKILSETLQTTPKKVEHLFDKTLKDNIIENKKIIKIISRLKNKGYKLGILSNQSVLSNDILIPKKIINLFDASIISCIDKVKKPSPEAFKLILKKLKSKPKKAIFIDDKQNNVDAAEKLGIKGIFFQNNRQFLRDLKKFGVKT